MDTYLLTGRGLDIDISVSAGVQSNQNSILFPSKALRMALLDGNDFVK